MAPNPFPRLADHRVRIWRSTEGSDAYGSATRSYAIVADDVPALVNRSTAPVNDAGAGLSPIGRRRLYVPTGTDVQARDVVQIVSGPSAPGRWEVDEPPVSPRGHHLQVDTTFWRGRLPGDA